MKKRYLILIIVAFMGLTVWFLSYFPQIQIDEDITRYISEGDENLEVFNEVNETFNVNNVLIVALDWPRFWEEITGVDGVTRELSGIYGVKDVSSLTNTISMETNETDIIVGSLRDNYDLETLAPERIKDIILSDKTLRENYISDDQSSILFILSLKDNEKININESMEAIIAYLRGLDKDFHISGNPVTSYELARLSGQDTLILIPVAAGLITFVLLFMFRTKTGLFLPLLTVVLADIWIIGTELIAGVTLSSVLMLIPIIMIGIGVDNAIHFISRYYEERHLGLSAAESVKQSYRDVGKPMVLACLTTAAGLMSLLTASILPVSQLGIFGSIEILYILLISTVLIPAFLLLFKPKSRAVLNEKGESSFLKKITSVVLDHKKITLIVIAVLAGFMALQFPNLKAQVDLADFLGDESIAIKGSDYLQAHYGGDDQIYVYINGEGSEDMHKDFYYHRTMRDIQAFSEQMDYISSSRSLSDTVAELSGAFSETPHIPGSNSTMDQLFFLISDDTAVKQLTSMETNESRAILTGNYDTNLDDIFKLTDPIKDFMNTVIIKDYSITRFDAGDPETVSAWKNQMVQFLKARKAYQDDINLDELLELKTMETETLFSRLDTDRLYERFSDFLEYYAMPTVSREAFNQFLEAGPEEMNDLRFNYEEFVYREEIPLRTEMAADIIRDYDLPLDDDEVKELAAYINDTQVPVRDDATRHLDIKLTGSAFIASGIQTKIVESQVSSLIIAIFIVLTLFVIQMRSFLVGFVSMLPLLLTLLFNFGFIAGLGFSLNAATVTIASILIGLGIDYAIHFLNRFRIELAQSHDKRKALLRTAGTTGRGIFSGAMTTFFSFFPLAFARASLMSQFGLIAAFNVLITMLLVFTLLPILLMAIPERYLLKHKKRK